MKRFATITLTTALCLSVSALAQHGHGMSGGMGGMNMGHHSSMSTHSKMSGTHGQRTMQQKLSTNSDLSAKIAKLAGMPAQDACAGFKNLGQCMATAHVSQNLGIPFASLKDTELGLNADGTQSTTAKPMSLGKAIQTLAPQADSKTELKKANQQSKDDADSVDGEMDSEF